MIPPISASLTPVFHQEYSNVEKLPNFVQSARPAWPGRARAPATAGCPSRRGRPVERTPHVRPAARRSGAAVHWPRSMLSRSPRSHRSAAPPSCWRSRSRTSSRARQRHRDGALRGAVPGDRRPAAERPLRRRGAHPRGLPLAATAPSPQRRPALAEHRRTALQRRRSSARRGPCADHPPASPPD